MSKCARPACDDEEFRIDGYCSVYCRDVDEAWNEVDEIKEELRLLRDVETKFAKLAEAYGLTRDKVPELRALDEHRRKQEAK